MDETMKCRILKGKSDKEQIVTCLNCPLVKCILTYNKNEKHELASTKMLFRVETLYLAGKSDEDIAKALFVTLRTVQRNIARIRMEGTHRRR